MNGLTLLALIALAIGIVLAYRAGRIAGRGDARAPDAPPFSQSAIDGRNTAPTASPPPADAAPDEAEVARLRAKLERAEAFRYHAEAFAEDRRTLFESLAAARADAARYRELVVDFETHAPLTLLGGPGSHDDLKLIVGIGPMLERMLHQLGVTTYRQIARWSEHDIDAYDAKLPEFPGRIRRDGWVVQARALHQSKYGERA